MRRCVEIYAEYVQKLKGFINPEKFTTSLLFQPIPSYMVAIGQRRGGNMLGLDDVNFNAVMFTAGFGVYPSEGEGKAALAYAELMAMTAEVKKLSKLLNGEMDFIFLNYADAVQDPLGSYGLKNVQHMRQVAAGYDPTGVFQTRIPGGFKISRVKDQ